MKYARIAVYLMVVVYTLLALLKPKKIYVDRFTHDIGFIEWALLQPFPTMYSSESILKVSFGRDRSVWYLCHHPMKPIINRNYIFLDSVTYELTVRYRGYKTVKKFIVFKDSLYTSLE
jgi:hypothetical protein